MSSANTFGGFVNLPAVSFTAATETGYVIPSAGTYPGLPSPAQAAANWLVLPVQPGDVNGGILDYGRPFKVRVGFSANIANSENLTVKLYQCTNAKFQAGVTATANGTQIATTGTVATGGAVKGQFFMEAICTWDSASKILNGYFQGWTSLSATQGGVAIAQTKLSNSPSSLNETDLNFFFTVTAATATGDTFGPIDFTVDRV